MTAVPSTQPGGGESMHPVSHRPALLQGRCAGSPVRPGALGDEFRSVTRHDAAKGVFDLG
jgi:hypothetical protein